MVKKFENRKIKKGFSIMKSNKTRTNIISKSSQDADINATGAEIEGLGLNIKEDKVNKELKEMEKSKENKNGNEELRKLLEQQIKDLEEQKAILISENTAVRTIVNGFIEQATTNVTQTGSNQIKRSETIDQKQSIRPESSKQNKLINCSNILNISEIKEKQHNVIDPLISQEIKGYGNIIDLFPIATINALGRSGQLETEMYFSDETENDINSTVEYVAYNDGKPKTTLDSYQNSKFKENIGFRVLQNEENCVTLDISTDGALKVDASTLNTDDLESPAKEGEESKLTWSNDIILDQFGNTKSIDIIRKIIQVDTRNMSYVCWVLTTLMITNNSLIHYPQLELARNKNWSETNYDKPEYLEPTPKEVSRLSENVFKENQENVTTIFDSPSIAKEVIVALVKIIGNGELPYKARTNNQLKKKSKLIHYISNIKVNNYVRDYKITIVTNDSQSWNNMFKQLNVGNWLKINGNIEKVFNLLEQNIQMEESYKYADSLVSYMHMLNFQMTEQIKNKEIGIEAPQLPKFIGLLKYPKYLGHKIKYNKVNVLFYDYNSFIKGKTVLCVINDMLQSEMIRAQLFQNTGVVELKKQYVKIKNQVSNIFYRGYFRDGILRNICGIKDKYVMSTNINDVVTSFINDNFILTTENKFEFIEEIPIICYKNYEGVYFEGSKSVGINGNMTRSYSILNSEQYCDSIDSYKLEETITYNASSRTTDTILLDTSEELMLIDNLYRISNTRLLNRLASSNSNGYPIISLEEPVIQFNEEEKPSDYASNRVEERKFIVSNVINKTALGKSEDEESTLQSNEENNEGEPFATINLSFTKRANEEQKQIKQKEFENKEVEQLKEDMLSKTAKVGEVTVPDELKSSCILVSFIYSHNDLVQRKITLESFMKTYFEKTGKKFPIKEYQYDVLLPDICEAFRVRVIVVRLSQNYDSKKLITKNDIEYEIFGKSGRLIPMYYKNKHMQPIVYNNNTLDVNSRITLQNTFVSPNYNEKQYSKDIERKSNQTQTTIKRIGQDIASTIFKFRREKEQIATLVEDWLKTVSYKNESLGLWLDKNRSEEMNIIRKRLGMPPSHQATKLEQE